MVEIRQRVIKALTEHFEGQAVLCSHDANIVDVWELDSLDMVEAVMALEEEFQIEIGDEDLDIDEASINHLTALVQRKLKESKEPAGIVFDIETGFPLTGFNRFEIIDHRKATAQPGRVLVAYGATIQVSVQDKGQTVKVFVSD